MSRMPIREPQGGVLPTVTEGVTAAETPVCPTHHRPMTAREPGTPEQAWCGQWWRCDEPGTPQCLTTALIPSADLIRQEETL